MFEYMLNRSNNIICISTIPQQLYKTFNSVRNIGTIISKNFSNAIKQYTSCSYHRTGGGGATLLVEYTIDNRTTFSDLELNKVMEPEESQELKISKSSNSLKKKSSENGKRFTDEQVKLLESMFRLETKLEPRKKLQLARDLGLQPRQVAIWFQNKRARWKTKQLENEYIVLKAKFDHLNMQFQSLKTEKERLLIQLELLNDQLENNVARGSRSEDLKDNELYTSSENGGTELELKDSPGCSNARIDHKRIKEDQDDDTAEETDKYFTPKEEAEFWNLEELGDNSLEQWCVGLGSSFNQSCNNSELWDF